MAGLSDLAPLTSGITALSNLILVSPQDTIGYQPQVGTPLAPALLFHYEGEQSVSLTSDITDHYVEDNISIQDQISIKPEIISTRGFIGELNDIAPKVLVPLQVAAEKLTIISAYTPSLSATAILAYNEAFFLYQVGKNAVDSAVATWSSINKTDKQNVIGSNGLVGGVFNPFTGKVSNRQSKQQVAFQQFYGYWRNRTLFTVQTPWAVFQNMAIQSLRAIQDSETKMISDFEVSFKMIRLASTGSLNETAKEFDTRAAIQNASLVDQGTSPLIDDIDLSEGLAQV